MSYINKNWFYIIDENCSKEINISENIYVSLFVKNIKDNLNINIAENSKVDFYWFFKDYCPENILINQENNNSILNLKSIFIGNNSDLISNIESKIKSNNSKANLNVIWIVKENKISINSSINISKNSKKIEAHLELENIFVWNNWTINSLPNLFIESNDVKVSHSSKSHRLQDQKVFYIKSRWLDEKQSINLMLQSYFFKNFSCIEMFNKDIYNEILKEFLN